MSLSFHNTSRPPRFERATAANCTRQSRNSAAAEKLMLAVRKAAAKLEAPEVEREAVVEELQPRVNPWELLRPAQDDAQSTGVEVRGGSSSSQHRPHSDDHHDGEDCDVSHDDEGVSAAPVVATRLPYVPPSAPVANADVGGAHPDTTTMNMLHCLFAMAFAALTLGVLTFVGVIVQTSSTCPSMPGYSRCAMWQDFRSVLSFLLGALLCCLFSHGKERATPFYAPERAEKVQLYAYML
mmetsp:Transcript_78871/g.225972  ORF Transcript_78871/g.225972 Transcript_78871/m.225972 type:complete len:239 (-) Transcript_78871:34-750(-)|eukprot:CAMPEP_0177345436 /NCGR_PEP_ID=MMETSP0368-20130122/28646_1 /TAXON_ID=447022 ORGANISM="Scrippsiella hangoei-like, Strain SHHI-4" /NCGR_SAMPLE_ID=MMETSP0368 /ASSEMBLY_ACC=CAM_ASM_000363 /LENGTH=238 /DNA_ID=CAMNT_0018807011 /DNA_START=183 /DNA_END=899 /DNA_ORIENTATION=-